MKIINYEGLGLITCDNALITCDNTLITCDATALINAATLKVIPREMVDEIHVTLYNELTFAGTTFTTTTSNSNGYMTFAVPIGGIKEGDSFEMTIRKDDSDGEIIYRDKAYATIVTDLENYKLNYPNNNGVIIM